MEIEFHRYDGGTVALNPRIERNGGQFVMKLDEQNCDYFLLLSRTPGGRVDLQDENMKRALVGKKDLFPSVQNEILTENVMFSCIEWSDYRVNDYAIDLSNRIAEYTIIGCKEEQGRLIVFVPDADVNCTASVSLTVSYRISQVQGEPSRRLFSKNVPQQAVYVIEFDSIPNYQDGGIIYHLEGLSWDYPVTRGMIEKGKFYINAGHGMPKFSAAISGLELRQL